MKVFCVINNNAGGEGTEPFWYMLPDSSVVRSGNPFFVPDFDTEFKAFPSVAVRIDRLGKSIAPRFAPRYYSEVTAGVAVAATGLLERLRGGGMPWDRAVAFDRSCFIGDYIPSENLFAEGGMSVVCGGVRRDIRLEDMKYGIDGIIAEVSRTNTLKTGDIVLAALAADGIPLIEGNTLEAYCGDSRTLEIRIR